MAFAWEQRKLSELVDYTASSLTAKDALDEGDFALYDANSKIGYVNTASMRDAYITIIKDGAGVGRVRMMPENTAFIGTMGALKAKNSNLEFVYALLTKFDLRKKVLGSTIPHIYFKDYGKNCIVCLTWRNSGPSAAFSVTSIASSPFTRSLE
ncbi:MAG: restriction endonuclease subunit S [Bacteroides sp.]|nr:restriction endonuclease subunit S [Bacteroides sp.]MCM1549250.1 restriction endonuclease subunit S [Clostridium sp.]